MKKTLFLIGLVMGLGTGCTRALPGHSFTILYTNDDHGEFEPCG